MSEVEFCQLMSRIELGIKQRDCEQDLLGAKSRDRGLKSYDSQGESCWQRLAGSRHLTGFRLLRSLFSQLFIRSENLWLFFGMRLVGHIRPGKPDLEAARHISRNVSDTPERI
jgi:hypothetical protein